MENVRAHQRAFLEALQAKTEPYRVQIKGIELVVDPGVFPPTTDSRLLADYIVVSAGENVLDLTTGCGTISVIAGLQGASGIAVDINPKAVENADKNFKRFRLPMVAMQSDLFSNVPREEFDLIVANGPYLEFEGEIGDPLEYAFYGAHRFVTSLFSAAPDYLKDNGRLLVPFAEWGELKFFEDTAKACRFSFKVLGKRTSDDGQRIYRLYELRQK
ncbi:MAG TPA: methyltransferase [Candidatus Paceibacterota bacterium]